MRTIEIILDWRIDAVVATLQHNGWHGYIGLHGEPGLDFFVCRIPGNASETMAVGV